jgi:hypothetical protein
MTVRTETDASERVSGFTTANIGRNEGGIGMRVEISSAGFERWVKNLPDANVVTCMAWFGSGRTVAECFVYLSDSWTREEIATAFL